MEQEKAQTVLLAMAVRAEEVALAVLGLEGEEQTHKEEQAVT